MKALPLTSALCALLTSGSLHASESAPAPAQAEPACIEVEVNGQRVPAYDCLTLKLNPAAAANEPRQDLRLKSERIATRPSNEIALFNRAATSQRMGNTFGRSVHPQRPPAPIVVSPIVKKTP